ncbi:MAG: hypothetical protein AAF918_17265 [Pseudomonadota bacterium]
MDDRKLRILTTGLGITQVLDSALLDLVSGRLGAAAVREAIA